MGVKYKVEKVVNGKREKELSFDNFADAKRHAYDFARFLSKQTGQMISQMETGYIVGITEFKYHSVYQFRE